MKKSTEKNTKSVDGIVFAGNSHRKESLAEGKIKKHYFRKIFKKKTFLFLGVIFLLVIIGLAGFKFRHKIKIPNAIKWKNFSITFSDSVNKEENIKPADNQIVEEKIDQPGEPIKTEAEIESEQQEEAKKWLEENAQNKVILANAKKEMGEDLVMVRYEYEKQLANLEWINSQSQHPEIMKKAKKEWGDDYEMVRYLYEEEMAKIKGEKN